MPLVFRGSADPEVAGTLHDSAGRTFEWKYLAFMKCPACSISEHNVRIMRMLREKMAELPP